MDEHFADNIDFDHLKLAQANHLVEVLEAALNAHVSWNTFDRDTSRRHRQSFSYGPSSPAHRYPPFKRRENC